MLRLLGRLGGVVSVKVCLGLLLLPARDVLNKVVLGSVLVKVGQVDSGRSGGGDGGKDGDKGFTKGKACVCEGCNETFPSKNALFRHLRETLGKCLPPHEYQEFLIHVVNNQRNLDKIGVLYGYLPSQYYLDGGEELDDIGVTGGDLAAVMVLQAIDKVSLGAAAGEALAPPSASFPPETFR